MLTCSAHVQMLSLIPQIIYYVKNPGMLVIALLKFKVTSTRVFAGSKQVLESLQYHTQQAMFQH